MIPFSSLTVDAWNDLGQPTKSEYEATMAKAAVLDERKRELLKELKREVEPLEREQARAENIYGPAGVRGGGAAPGSRYVPPELREEQWRRDFAQRFNDGPRSRYGERVAIGTAEIDRFTTGRFIEHLRGEVARVAGYRGP